MSIDDKSCEALPVLLSPRELGRVLGWKSARIYRALGTGALPMRRVGKRIYIPRESLRQWLESTEEGWKR